MNPASLPRGSVLLKGADRPDDPDDPARIGPVSDGVALRDVFPAAPFDAAPTLFAFAALAARGAAGPVLWVQDRMSRREGGMLYEAGLRRATGLRAPFLRVEVSHPKDVLWTMEEGAGCAALAGVIGEVHGDPKALDFTATKRLTLRSERSGVPVWLLRSSAADRSLSAARERWSVGTVPAAAHAFDPAAPGRPRWRADLFRARSRPPGSWSVTYDPVTGRFDMAGPAYPETDRETHAPLRVAV